MQGCKGLATARAAAPVRARPTATRARCTAAPSIPSARGVALQQLSLRAARFRPTGTTVAGSRRRALSVRAKATDVAQVPNLSELAKVGLTTPVGDLVRPLAPGKPIVLHLLRRFGWVLCRDYAFLLSEIKPELDAMGVELVALGHEMLGVGEFYTSGYWGGKLYIDKTKAVFGALGTNQGNLLGLLSGQTMEAGKAATERGTKGNLEGDGFQLGGVWVFDAAGVCTYAYTSDSFGDHPKAALVLEQAIKAAGVEQAE